MKQIDAKSVEFLSAVEYYGGEANITEIRSATGLNRNEANYRFRKLGEMDLITVGKEETPMGELEDRKVAHLTGKARRELERGLGGALKSGLVISDDPTQTEISRERFVELEDAVKRLREAQRASIEDDTEYVPIEKFEELRDYVYEWNEATATYIKGIRHVVEKYVPGVDDLQNHIESK